ncbi:MAG: dienelactone hydrolase family protein [Gammaproteobacteria bacterium]|nr:dienelactone hydrolase family protein [Gammaproteobacteria bacterium]
MRQKRSRFVSLLTATTPFWLSSISNIAHAVGDEQVASAAPTLLHAEFSYPRIPITDVEFTETHGETKKYRVFSLSFRSSGENGQVGNLVTALYYQSKLPGAKRVVIVLPIWGTHTYPSRKMTQSLLKYSDGQMNVLRILGKDFLFDWTAMGSATSEAGLISLARRMAERIRTHVVDIRRSIDWVETQPDVDPNRIGLVGFSIGAFVASLVAANEPRLAATVLAMGSAHVHEMLATCFGRAKAAREAIMSRFGWTTETLKKKIEKPLAPVDPARLAGRVDPSRVLMFDAEYDECMPSVGREVLWQAMGRPKRVTWPYGHKMSFIMMTFLGLNRMRHEIYDFLEATL